MNKLDELITEHQAQRKRGGRDHQLAEIEERMFRHPDAPVQPEAIKWVARLVGDTVYAIRLRRDLFQAGDAVAPLWELLFNGVSLKTAHDIMSHAKRISRRNSNTMKYNEERFVEAVLAGVRERRLGHMISQQDTAESRVLLPDVTEPSESESPTEFWARVRFAIRAFASTQDGLPDLSENEREQMLRELDTDVTAVFDQHRAKWARLKRREAEARAVTRSQFRSALLVLHLDPPKRGEALRTVNFQARRQYRNLARVYHPDSNGGSEEMRSQYQAVVDAYETVRRYVEEHKDDAVETAPPERPALHVVHGEKE